MQFDALNADLKQWLRSSIAAGHDRDALLQALRGAGYDAGYARLAVDAALARLRPGAAANGRGGTPAAGATAARTATAAERAAADGAAAEGTAAGGQAAEGRAADDRAAGEPDRIAGTDPQAVDKPNRIAVDDRTVEVLMTIAAPRVAVFGNLLSSEECERMIELARPRLARSTVVNAASGAYDVHPDRTSSGTHFARGENELVARIERRIAALIGQPVENGEPIQILHYPPGGEYKPHYDYFDAAQPGNEKVLAAGGQRIATLIMYLNDVEAGGSTVFPAIGLDVMPRRGNAVYFEYRSESGQPDARTLHGGSPVRAGEKWIATKWIRERRYPA